MENTNKSWVDFAVCLFLGPLGVHKFREKKIGLGILYLCTLGLFGVGWIYDTVRYFLAAVKGRDTNSSSSGGSDDLDDGAPLPTVLGHDLMLKAGETCHYYGQATSIKLKNVVTGYSGGSSGVSVRIAKGVSYRVGQRRSAPIRGTVQERYPGFLAVTNMRIVFNASQGAFDKNVSSLSSLAPLDDGLVFQFGATQYIVETKDAKRVKQIVDRVYQASNS